MRISTGFALMMVFCVSMTVPAFGQYGGGMGGVPPGGGVYKAPAGGYSSSTGIAIGAAAAGGVVLAYFLLRNRGKVDGCIQPSANGNVLLKEKDQKTYTLLASNSVVLPPDHQVALKVKKAKDGSGKTGFEVQKLIKDYGTCKK